jgi:hypothetical protein
MEPVRDTVKIDFINMREHPKWGVNQLRDMAKLSFNCAKNTLNP